MNEFCDLVGVTRRGNENIIALSLLELCVTKDLDLKAQRVFAVLDPVKVIIDNRPNDYNHPVTAPYFPKDPSKGGYTITLTKEFYVDRSDVRLDDNKDFYGFAPNRVVGLKYCYAVRVKEILTDDKGEVTEIHVEIDDDAKTKAKTYLNWLPVKESISCIVNLYDVLFLSYDPNEDEDWRSSINPNSLVVKSSAKVHKSLQGNIPYKIILISYILLGVKPGDKFQFERIGYFCVDKDTNAEKGVLVFNKTVGLESKGKQKALGTK